MTQDVDLWFRRLDDPAIRRALRRVGGVFVSSMGLNPPVLAGDCVDLFDVVVHMHGLQDFDAEWVHAKTAHFGSLKVKILSLDQIIRSKRATGREKDKLAIRVLRSTIAAQAKRRGRTSPGRDPGQTISR